MPTKERVRVRLARSENPVKKQEEESVHELPMMAPPLSRYAARADAPDDESNADDTGSKQGSGKSALPTPPPDGDASGDSGQTDVHGIADLAELGFGKQSVFSVINSQPFTKEGGNVDVENKKKKKSVTDLLSFAAPPFRFSDGITQFKLIPKDLPPGEFDESPSNDQQVDAPELANHDFEAAPPPPAPVQTPEGVSKEVTNKIDQETKAGENSQEDLGNDKNNTAGKMPDPRRGSNTPTSEEPKKKTRSSSPPANGIPDSIRAKMESVFNIDVSSLNIVQNSGAAKAAGALAFAAGNTIHFAPGQFSPETPQGQHLLGHELAHVVQQREGRVQANGEMNGMAINNDQRLEAEADAMAQRAVNAEEPSSESASLATVSAPSAPVSQLQDDGSNLYATYEELLVWAAEQKTKIQTDTTALKEEVTKLGEDQKTAISTLIDTQIQKMKDAIKTAQDHIRTTTDNAKTTITTHREAKVTEVNTTADTEITAIEEMVEAKKKHLTDKGETHATGILSHAETEANRAVNESTSNSTQVSSVITSTASNYQDRDGIDQAVTEAQKGATDLKTKFTEMGDTMACEVREDATGMATDIRQEALDASSQFDQPLADARTNINKKRDETVTALQGSGDNLLTTLETETTESITALDQQIPTQEASLRAYADGTTETIDKAVRDVHGVIDTQMQNAASDIDDFVKQLEEIGWHSAEIEAAKTDLEAALTGHREDIDAKKKEMTTQLDQHKTEVQTGSDELTSAIDTTLSQVSTDFDNEVNPKVEEIKGEMDTMTTEACDEIKTVKPAMEPELEDAVCETEEKWDENIESARSDISTKVDTGLESQRDTLSDFSSRINDEFSSLPSKDRGFWESLWEGIKDIGAFIGGVFVGIFQGLWEMLKGIWEIIITPAKWLLAAVVIIAAVIVIALVAFFAGISFGLAALIVGAIVGIGFMLYYFYQAATAEGLSPYERGKLVGRGIFEGLMAFAGTGVLARLGSWVGRISKIGQIVSKVGGLGQFLKMAVWVDDVERLINIINKTDDIGRLAAFFGKLDNAKDAAKLLDLIDNVGDVGKIATLLGEGKNISKVLGFIDDVGRFSAVLDKVGDVSALAKLIETGKLKSLTQLDGLLTKLDDVSRVEALMSKVDDAAQLERLLGSVGDDAAKLESLLTKTGNGAAAERFLQQLKAMEDKLLASGITKVDDGSGIIRYVDNTGKEIATLDDWVMKYSYGGHGGEIIMDPNRTTTIIGKFQDPTTPGWGTEWVHNLPEGSFSRQGDNPGGLNMLDVDPHTWDQLLIEAGGDAAKRNEIFWHRYNLPFLEQSFKNGDNIRLLSDASNPATRTGTYLRELEAIEGAGGFAEKYGYIFDAASQTYKPGPRWTGSPLSAVDNTAGAVDNVAGTLDNTSGLLDESGRFKSGPGGAGWVDEAQSSNAAKFYEEMEALTNGSDVVAITQNTGIGSNIIQRVRSHLFVEEHTVMIAKESGELVPVTGKFAPFDNIAELWKAAMEGKLSGKQLDDFSDLLAHEYIEAKLMEKGLPYRHPSTYRDGVSFPRPGDGLGAHDIAPHDQFTQWLAGKAESGVYTAEELGEMTRFNHWQSYFGITYNGPKLAKNLSNIDEVISYILVTFRLN